MKDRRRSIYDGSDRIYYALPSLKAPEPSTGEKAFVVSLWWIFVGVPSIILLIAAWPILLAIAVIGMCMVTLSYIIQSCIILFGGQPPK